MKIVIALLKREILEHKNIWRVPLVLIVIAVLVKLSLSVGNLSINLDVPDQLQLDGAINSALDGVVASALNSMNYLIALVMFVVSIFYALSCLYNERQDESVLFWRSLPISDGLTIASKLIVALILIPIVIVLSQTIVAVVFFDVQAFEYLSTYYSYSFNGLLKMILWSLVPIIAWCVLCSQVAKKNPFLLAFIAPIILILIDKLFLNGAISQTFVINRLTGVSDYNITTFVYGLIFSAICISLAIAKRKQRF